MAGRRASHFRVALGLGIAMLVGTMWVMVGIDLSHGAHPDGGLGHVGVVAAVTVVTVWLTAIALRFDREREERGRNFQTAMSALQSASDGIMITDATEPDNPIVFCNASFLAMTGYAEQEVLGRNPRFLAGLGDSPERRRLRDAVRDGREIQVELQNRRKDGTLFWCSLRLSVIRGPDGRPTHFVGVQTDIGARKQAEAELFAAIERAETANASKSLFLANMSHELRTPLNAIIGFSEILTGRVFKPSPDMTAEYAGTIHEAGQQLLTLVNDLLDVAHLEMDCIHLDLEPVRVDRLLEDVSSAIVPRARAAGLDMTVVAPADLPPLRADRKRLKQILLNLLTNAVKFTPRGGRIAVTAGFADGPPDRITLSVRDTGIGMEPHDVERGLRPFVQGDAGLTRNHDGAGLGLFIAHRLAVQMGGTVTIDSAPGRGTTVTVTLPADGAEAADDGNEAASPLLAAAD